MFGRRKPSPAEAAHVLNELRCLSDRERIRARARLREQMGLPPAPELEPRA